MTAGALFAFLAVLAGAFGAHGLQHVLDEPSLKVWQTGVTYQMYHALALILVALVEAQTKKKLRGVKIAFGAGIVLFSGSLYALALSGVKMLGIITPLGGLAFLFGWAMLAWKARAASA